MQLLEESFTAIISISRLINNYHYYINTKLGLAYKTSNYKYLINSKNEKNIRTSLVYNILNHKHLINSNYKKIKNLNSILYAYKYCSRKKKRSIKKYKQNLLLYSIIS